MVDLQQFYMAMSVHHLLHAAYLYSPISLLTHRYIRRREVDPDNLNKVHRSGSVPPLLAITKGDHTVLREILLILLLLKDVPYIDECTGWRCGEPFPWEKRFIEPNFRNKRFTRFLCWVISYLRHKEWHHHTRCRKRYPRRCGDHHLHPQRYQHSRIRFEYIIA